MSYNFISYFAIFLPIVMIAYQLTPQKYRCITMLVANFVFFYLISGKLIIYILLTTLFTHYIGLWIENTELTTQGSTKVKTKKKKQVLAFGIFAVLLVLIVLKYTNFFGKVLAQILSVTPLDFVYKPVEFMIPIGISFYTLQVISYITDVYRGTQPSEHNVLKLALYLSFFPQIMEGPISRYNEVGPVLYEGKDLSYKNITYGYQRIVWGLFKKVVVADRIAATVAYIFTNYDKLSGSVILMGAVCYTCQLYMEFSGCMDIIIGSGEIFGVKLPENFRQPFMAKDASEFWRRWHITLGTFFKDYIFYPVSLAKGVNKLSKKIKKRFGRTVAKFAGPTVALFCVWLCNGLWHGANWTFIFYGMYYFVLIFIENITEEPVQRLAEKMHINRQGKAYTAFRRAKLFVIVIIGEMFFRADTLSAGFTMLGKIFTDFRIHNLMSNIFDLKMTQSDVIVVVFGVIIVSIVGFIREKGISVRDRISSYVLPVRWSVWYGLTLAVVIFGAYGSGYSVVEMIYAAY